MSNVEQWAKEALLHSNAKPGDAARELLRQAEVVGQTPHLVRVLRELVDHAGAQRQAIGHAQADLDAMENG